MLNLDARVFAALILMGAAAIAVKLDELWRWYVDEQPLSRPVVIDTQRNGGVTAPHGPSR